MIPLECMQQWEGFGRNILITEDKMKQKLYILLMIAAVSLSFLSAAGRIAILPIHSLGMDKYSTRTAENILIQEISMLTPMQVISRQEIDRAMNDSVCSDAGCAANIGEKVGADQAVLCTMSILGEKIIVQYLAIDVAKKQTIIGDSVTADSVESLDTIMKRIASSIVNQTSISESAEVGSIIEKENDNMFRRREARSYTGVSFGYMYPQHGYGDVDRSLTLDFRKGYDMEDFFVGMQMATRKGISANIFTDYLMSRGDFCPYIGAGLGFHWVAHSGKDDLRNDGFEMLLSMGVRAFRTYNFQILANLDYTVTFNDYNDKAVIFTIGLLW